MRTITLLSRKNNRKNILFFKIPGLGYTITFSERVRMSEKTIGMTVTGEIFQPVRLYYTVSNRQRVETCLGRLRCMNVDAPQKRWIWLYDEEAKCIDFKNKFSSLPENIRPVIIGSLVWKSAETLILDVRSFERALAAIQFFDKHISRSLAKVTHCATVNRIFEITESSASNFDVFFENNDKLVEIDPDAFMDKVRATPLSKNGSPDLQAIISFLDNEMDRFFEIEKFPTHFYEDGIESLRGSFIFRRTIALERWEGNVNYSFKDAFNKFSEFCQHRDKVNLK
jgi:hypothetical protein